ncbi:MAG: transcription elongation factor Spt5 [Thermoprotei archaeon]|nr:MAG: transcription elongation factor Spt5 [Thermoprotei archaeon]RLF24532.1 MAG: transcription elongation factor Spt5 [Thermoprotei archaeon]
MSSEARMISNIYAVRTTVGQEKNVALLVASRVFARKIPVRSILVVDGVRGFVFIEAPSPQFVDRAIMGIKHVKGRVKGKVNFADIEKLLFPKPVIEDLDIGDKVEIVSGPFRGMKAKVVRIDRPKQEVTVELLEVPYPLPITVSADYIKLLEKAKK